MNHENRPEAAGWYAPLNPAPVSPQQEAAPAKKKKKLPVGWRVFLGSLLAVGLIAGSSLLFSNGERDSVPILLPELPIEAEPDDGNYPAQMPDNWQDYFDSYYVTEDSDREKSKIPAVEARPDWQLELTPAGKREKSLQEIYRSCVDSIVSISGYVDGKVGFVWGTGIVLSEDGLILTNAHMIEGCDSATVKLSDGSEYEARLVGEDTTSDIAVLKIEATGLQPAVFGESDQLNVGDRVAAIGNPLAEDFRATLTDGIVSAIDRGISYNGHSMNLIQTNTAINEGNSGGALFNMYGQVIGVTNMKMMSSYSSIEGIGFAIPSVTVRNVANLLIRDGIITGRPAVGITVGAITSDAADYYHLPNGLYVSDVSPDSDAWVKGIRPGDIVTAVNGEPATSTEDIMRVKDKLGVGDTISFTIWRDGKSFDVEVALVEYNDIY